jgi:hypothetical protein
MPETAESLESKTMKGAGIGRFLDIFARSGNGYYHLGL